jgi:peptide/nickel transport system substrate-binding protein
MRPDLRHTEARARLAVKLVWPCRWQSTDEAERARLADQIQVRAYQVVPYINGGQWKQFTAVRTNVSGLGETAVPVFWEVAKEG